MKLKTLTTIVLVLFITGGIALAHETAKLKDAHIEFKTGTKKKKADTALVIQVYCRDGSIAAKNDPGQTYDAFQHFTQSEPIALTVDNSKAKDDIKGGYHMIRIEPAAGETWTFSYVLTLNFDDGSHLTYIRNNREVTQDDPTVRGKNL